MRGLERQRRRRQESTTTRINDDNKNQRRQRGRQTAKRHIICATVDAARTHCGVGGELLFGVYLLDLHRWRHATVLVVSGRGCCGRHLQRVPVHAAGCQGDGSVQRSGRTRMAGPVGASKREWRTDGGDRDENDPTIARSIAILSFNRARDSGDGVRERAREENAGTVRAAAVVRAGRGRGEEISGRRSARSEGGEKNNSRRERPGDVNAACMRVRRVVVGYQTDFDHARSRVVGGGRTVRGADNE